MQGTHFFDFNKTISRRILPSHIRRREEYYNYVHSLEADIAEKDASLAEKDAEIAELKRKLNLQK